jgi:hypothetical protein
MTMINLSPYSFFIRSLACCGLACTLSLGTAQANTLSYADLCHRLTTLDGLAQLPPDGEKSAEATSYDRASKYDAASDKYTDWGANGDGNGGGLFNSDKVTMAEITGPGFINRIWSAAPGNGHVRIYLDGSDTPVVDLPFVDYFSGKAAPFNRSNLCYHTNEKGGGGWDNFVPIPFQKSCKIVADQGWGNYFHFGYTQFAPGTVLPTFTSNLAAADSAALDEANEVLGKCGEEPAGKRAGETVDAHTMNVSAGSSAVLADLSGAQAITQLKIKVPMPADGEEQRRFLSELAVRITWDDDAEPAIWAPLGDFFGFTGGGASFHTLPSGLTKDGWFYSYWYMPFAKKAHVEIVNDGPHDVSLETSLGHAPLTQAVDGLMRFHAKWHRNAFEPLRPDRMPDWTVLATQGRGRFVGMNLHVWFPGGGWWGEGDEKFFVDGEKFPSWIGTGSEDYFGYAWGDPAYFERPFHSQPLNEQNRGHIDDNRWHIVDNVPFQKSFEGCIEKYQNDHDSRYAATAFWYLAPGGADPYVAQPVEDRTDYWIQPMQVAQVIKGGDMQVVAKPAQDLDQHQQMFPTLARMWANDEQLWWKADVAGQHVDLQFPVKADGTYRVLIRPTLANNYGIAQLSIDGKNVGAPIDLYYREVTAGDAQLLDTLHLGAGPHTLGVTISGKNPASSSCGFGFDYLRLEPVR